MRELNHELGAAVLLFAGKETESNWTSRLSFLRKIRAVLVSENSITWRDNLLKGLHDCIPVVINSVHSNRTTVASETLSFVEDIGNSVGDSLVSYTLEIILSNLLKISSVTKKVMADKAFKVTNSLLSKIPFQHKLLSMLCKTAKEKNPQLREFASTYIQTVLKTHGSNEYVKSKVESTDLNQLIAIFIKEGLVNAAPSVRDGSKKTYLVYRRYWPILAEKLFQTLDSTIQRRLGVTSPSSSIKTATPTANKITKANSNTRINKTLRSSVENELKPGTLMSPRSSFSTTKSTATMTPMPALTPRPALISRHSASTTRSSIPDKPKLNVTTKAVRPMIEKSIQKSAPMSPQPSLKPVSKLDVQVTSKPGIEATSKPGIEATPKSNIETTSQPKTKASSQINIKATPKSNFKLPLKPGNSASKYSHVSSVYSNIKVKSSSERRAELAAAKLLRNDTEKATQSTNDSNLKTSHIPIRSTVIKKNTHAIKSRTSQFSSVSAPSISIKHHLRSKDNMVSTARRTQSEAHQQSKAASASLLHKLESKDHHMKCNGLRLLSDRLSKTKYDSNVQSINLPPDVPSKFDILPILMETLASQDSELELYEALMSWDILAGVFMYIMAFNYYNPTLIIADQQCRSKNLSIKRREIMSIYSKGLKRVKMFLKRNDPDLAQRLLTLMQSLSNNSAKDNDTLDISVKVDIQSFPSFENSLKCGTLEWMDEVVCDYIGLAQDEDQDIVMQGSRWLNVTLQESPAGTWFETSSNIKSYVSFVINELKQEKLDDDIYAALCRLLGHLKIANERVFENEIKQLNSQEAHIIDTAIHRMVDTDLCDLNSLSTLSSEESLPISEEERSISTNDQIISMNIPTKLSPTTTSPLSLHSSPHASPSRPNKRKSFVDDDDQENIPEDITSTSNNQDDTNIFKKRKQFVSF